MIQEVCFWMIYCAVVIVISCVFITRAENRCEDERRSKEFWQARYRRLKNRRL